MANKDGTRQLDKPDTDFLYRTVSGYHGHRLTWHSMACTTGKNAKYSRRTVYTPETRREAIKAKSMQKYGYEVFTYYTDHMAKCCTGKQETSSPSFTTRQAKSIFAKAQSAGLAAGNTVTPTPMVVGTPTTFMGNDIDYNKRTYYVADGACGFAWVVIRPGNSSLARQAVKLGIGHSAYGGGVEITIQDHGQSVARKEHHASAYANALREHGINASSRSRLD